MSGENGAVETIDSTAEEIPTVPEVGVTVPTGGAVMAVAPQVQPTDLIARLDAIKQTQAAAMKPEVDYGVIPGTGGKPTLLKPGAEKLSVLFQLDVQLVNEKIWGPDDHLTVISRATAFHAPTGARMGYGEGICTTREKKYGKRKQDRACPNCGATAIKKSKYPPRSEPQGEPGWYCFAKVGGCGAEFAAEDTEITRQPVGEIENPDLPDTWNTVVKMAEKRARVDVVLAVTGASALFTQDVEDGEHPEADDAQKPAPRTGARERRPSERPITGAQKGKINALMAEAGMSPEEASAVRVWFCMTAGAPQYDRLPSKRASELIDRLGDDGLGARAILDELAEAAEKGHEGARKILDRMEPVDA